MILHVDMDAFYAAVEQRDDPRLRGRPVVVGSPEGRGVVAAASYEARQYGIHSAMSGRRAKELCPHAAFVRSRIGHYAEISRQIREIFLRHTPVIQPLSLDEAFLDVRGCTRAMGSPETIGRSIKSMIRDQLDLCASVGIAPLKFVAKIASDFGKPDGFVVVTADSLFEFLDPLPIKRMWGVGGVAEQKLHLSGVRTIGDIRRLDESILRAKFGRWGDHLWRLANGIDPREVVPDHDAKQISHERTFRSDYDDDEMLRAVVSFLCEQVGRRVRRHDRMARRVTLKYRSRDFATYSHSQTLSRPSDSTQMFIDTATALLMEMRSRHPAPVRLLGVSVGQLTSPDAPRQLDLFETQQSEESRRLDEVSDALSDKLKDIPVHRASSHQWVDRKKK
ncbi:MAG: DNA polymerase IV [Planctomycetota bacterium]